MRAIKLVTNGDRADLEIQDAPMPSPGRHEALIKVHAASLNFRDHAVMNSPYGAATMAGRIPLSDGAGEVVAVGDGVSRVKPGDRVSANCFATWTAGPFRAEYHRKSLGFSMDGLLADYVVLPEDALVRLPDFLSYVEAASLPCAAVTAWSALNLVAPLAPGHTILIQGTGGVALFALQIAKLFGVRVLAITSSDQKAATLKQMGAEAVVNYTSSPDWDREILALTDGQGVDKVVDIAGDETIVKSAAATKIRGEIAVVGFAGGASAGLPSGAILTRSLILAGTAIGPRITFEALLDAMSAHQLRPIIDHVFAFDQYLDAYRRIESGQHIGKVVITVND